MLIKEKKRTFVCVYTKKAVENKIISTKELFRNVLSVLESGKKVKLTVHGYSMQPTFMNLKDHVVLQRPERKLRVGDIALYHVGKDGMMYLHRIVRIKDGGRMLYIRGDGNYSPFEHIETERVKAIVVEGTMFAKRMNFREDLWWFRVYSYLYMWTYPLRFVLIKTYVKLKNIIKKK